MGETKVSGVRPGAFYWGRYTVDRLYYGDEQIWPATFNASWSASASLTILAPAVANFSATGSITVPAPWKLSLAGEAAMPGLFIGAPFDTSFSRAFPGGTYTLGTVEFVGIGSFSAGVAWGVSVQASAAITVRSNQMFRITTGGSASMAVDPWGFSAQGTATMAANFNNFDSGFSGAFS